MRSIPPTFMQSGMGCSKIRHRTGSTNGYEFIQKCISHGRFIFYKKLYLKSGLFNYERISNLAQTTKRGLFKPLFVV